jgi:excinuclease ABC subunit A
MARKTIFIKGAREHNLKDFDLTIPKNKMIVVTGLSGSGKSSFAFDTLYAEGQRRYVESLSAYARQFIGMMQKPDVDNIEGLSPAISIDQKAGSKNPRSTVGTLTEIYDYLRLLMARAGVPHCPKCGQEIQRVTVEQMVDRLFDDYEGWRCTILGPIVRQRKGKHTDTLKKMAKSGYTKVRVDGFVYDIDEDIKIAKTKRHDIDIVVDRLKLNEDSKGRLADSLETALRLGEGVLRVQVSQKKQDDPIEMMFSENFACPNCDISIEEVEPRLFSFNSPYGACPDCDGLGRKLVVSEELLVPDPKLSIDEGAIKAPGMLNNDSWSHNVMKQVAVHFDIDTSMPWEEVPKEKRDILFYGSGKKTVRVEWQNQNGSTYNRRVYFPGIVNTINRRYKQTSSQGMREWYEQMMVSKPCSTCNGKRLKPEALAVTLGGKNIADITSMSIDDCFKFFNEIKLTERQKTIAKQVLIEVKSRLKFLLDVGLSYLTLNRASATLAGGEAQRLRLATQIGSGLGGVLYVLDEPSIGLHSRDNTRLLATLKRLRDLGNTLVVVEHDEETIRTADFLVDIGPGAGIHGGYVVATGSVDDVAKVPDSITGQFLAGQRTISVPRKRRRGNGHTLSVIGATEHNLKGERIDIPMGTLCVVTGVSGSGKSTLVEDVLHRYIARRFYGSRRLPGKVEKIDGLNHIDKVVSVDQSPIGRTPRSNPATYTGVFSPIRELFAKLPESRVRGYQPGRFSFNVKGGRCEACKGDGVNKIEMQFLPDVYVPCEICQGKRFNRETLEIEFKGMNISEILDLTVEEAEKLFENFPGIHNKLKMLTEVGLGYIKLGQSATTLSGGEAQRIKLTSELAKRSTGRTMYILDEPTTGLHMADVDRLIQVLGKLVSKGNTVLVIEHNMDVIKSADYLIDLGPEGGEQGGRLIACGVPEEVVMVDDSYTGQYLKHEIPESRWGKPSWADFEKPVEDSKVRSPRRKVRSRKATQEELADEIMEQFVDTIDED